MAEPVNPIAIRPSRPSATWAASVTASSTEARMARARGRKRSPAAVSSTLRVVRWNSTTPISASSALICWDSGGWAICSRSAARPKCASSATATKYWIRRSSIAAG